MESKRPGSNPSLDRAAFVSELEFPHRFEASVMHFLFLNLKQHFPDVSYTPAAL